MATPLLSFAVPSEMQDGGVIDNGPKGYDAWFASQLNERKALTGSMKAIDVVRGGLFNGMTLTQARARGPEMFKQLSPVEQDQWAERATGSDLYAPSERPAASSASTASGVPSVSEAFKNLPNQPDLSPSSGPRFAGPSPSAAARFENMAMRDMSAAKATEAAVKTKLAQQITNPAGTVDAARAVQAAALAKDGIADLGGGTRMLQNKSGTGYAQQGGAPVPGPHVFDNGKPVNMEASKRANSIVTIPGDNAIPSTAIKEVVAGQIAQAIPGASQRLQADRNREVSSYSKSVAAQLPSATGYLASLNTAPASTPQPVTQAAPAGPGGAKREAGDMMGRAIALRTAPGTPATRFNALDSLRTHR